MKIAIVYNSLTGNTKLIAEAIKEELANMDIVYFGEPKEGIEADLYIIGSWCDKGNCAKETEKFIKTLENKKIAYFGTAGFGSLEYYEKLYDRIKDIIHSNNNNLGYFYCMGKMPMAIRDRYVKMLTENPDDKNMKVSIENFDKALKHPNEADIIQAKDWAKSLLEK